MARLRLDVFTRDRRCFMVRLDSDHICRDQWGYPHASGDLSKLTIEHVKDRPMMGRRAPSDPAHCVALCWSANVGVPSKVTREAMRTYLRAVA